MHDKFHCLGVSNKIQKRAIQVLSKAPCGLINSDLFRLLLIESLTSLSTRPPTITKINSEIETLIEQNLIIRETRRGKHQIGLNKAIWHLPLGTMTLVSKATKKVNAANLFSNDIKHLFNETRKALKKEGVGSTIIGNAALSVLVNRFRNTGGE